jgi:ABC-type methionine transport system permease subunit
LLPERGSIILSYPQMHAAEQINRMNRPRRERNGKTLWAMIVLAFAFCAAVTIHPALTGSDELNGLLGVWLGLFISAWPAANFLNMILYEQALQRWRSTLKSDGFWILLNLAVLMAGLTVVIVGTKLFFKNWQ